MTADQATNPWYKAKDLLIDAFNDGKITIQMQAREAYNIEEYKEHFQKVLWERFRSNYNRLKKRIKKDQARRKVVLYQRFLSQNKVNTSKGKKKQFFTFRYSFADITQQFTV